MNAITITIISGGSSTSHDVDSPVTGNGLLASPTFRRKFGVSSNSVVTVNGASGGLNLNDGDVVEITPAAGDKN